LVVRKKLLIITVWTVVQAVLTATFNSYGDRQISTPHKINTPEPIDKKIGTVDCIRDGTSYTKFDRNPFTWGFWANGWNITKYYFYLFIYTSFFFDSLQVDPGWIFTRDSSKDVKSRKDVPFGVIKLKFNFKPLFIPQNRQILPQNGTLFFFDRNCLTMGALKSKLPSSL